MSYEWPLETPNERSQSQKTRYYINLPIKNVPKRQVKRDRKPTNDCTDLEMQRLYENSLSFGMTQFSEIDYDVGLKILEFYTFKEQIL